MEKWINRKKVMNSCPSKMLRSRCPSIRRTRQIRRELLMKQRDPNVSKETLDKLRARLRGKKSRGIAIDCKTCQHNIPSAETIRKSP